MVYIGSIFLIGHYGRYWPVARQCLVCGCKSPAEQRLFRSADFRLCLVSLGQAICWNQRPAKIAVRFEGHRLK